jgi:hypothetical protein
MRGRKFCIGLAFVTVACSGGRSGGVASEAPNASARANPRVITQDEINSVGVASIYEVIEKLRPTMLRSRGRLEREDREYNVDSSAWARTIKVYLDNEHLGEPSRLLGVPAAIVNQVEFITANDATVRFGAGHEAGAILVTSKYKAKSRS